MSFLLIMINYFKELSFKRILRADRTLLTGS